MLRPANHPRRTVVRHLVAIVFERGRKLKPFVPYTKKLFATLKCWLLHEAIVPLLNEDDRQWIDEADQGIPIKAIEQFLKVVAEELFSESMQWRRWNAHDIPLVHPQYISRGGYPFIEPYLCCGWFDTNG